MTMVEQLGNGNLQNAPIDARQLQAEFLHGSMLDNAQMSISSFPKRAIDIATNDAYPLSVWRCDYPLSVWRC
ncbi:MAG TPA: hypothetical protein VFU22_19530 [Roseiflexaceae bacterium]|nr:hypothetical protein [Roseiflexaceae bacterium]